MFRLFLRSLVESNVFKAVRSNVVIAAVFLIFIVFSPVLVYMIVFWGRWSRSPQNWAQYGDYLSGTAGVVIGTMGLVALIATLRLQMKESRDSKLAYANDKVEDHVFILLKRLDAILEDTDVQTRKSNGAVITVCSGRDSYRHFYKKLREIYKQRKASANADDNQRSLIRQSFDELYKRNGSDFGHYFRTLYRCIKLIDDSGLGDVEKQNLVSIVMAGFNKFELLMLFYNALSSNGGDKFINLIEKYGLLEHCDTGVLIDQSHKEFYKSTAYK